MKNNSQQRIRFYQVDAFSKGPFTGIPPRFVCWRRGLKIACCSALRRKNNLSETAFVVRQPDGFGLRWFTPAVEVDLCGHATLAAASVLLNQQARDRVRFFTRSRRAGRRRCMTKYNLGFSAWLFRHPSPRRKDCSRRWDWLKTQVKPGKPPILLSSLMTKRCWTRLNPTLTP